MASGKVETWAAIADFFGRSEACVKKWAQRDHLGFSSVLKRGLSGEVFARTADLARWRDANSARPRTVARRRRRR